MDFYEKHIDKNKVSRFLEIGVQDGRSIRAWRSWFPEQTIVEGWDIVAPPIIFGCDLRVVDQLDTEQMRRNITGMYDIILDDGGHTARMMQTSFSFLFPHCKRYIIEDLHAPWCGAEFMESGDINTLDILESLNSSGWNSPYSTAKQSEYINEYARVVEIFVRGDRSRPLSATAIIENRRNA